jgi:hypothetical protein
MTRSLAGRWLVLAVMSLLAALLMLALAAAPGPARAGLVPDTVTVSRLTGRASNDGAGLQASVTVTDTYGAIIAAETLLDPILTSTFLPFTSK